MRPSIRVKAAVGAGFLAVLAAMHLGLPSLARRVGGAETGLQGFEGKVVLAYAQNSEEAQKDAEFCDDFARGFVARWGRERGVKLPDSKVKIYLFPNVAAFQRHSMFRANTPLEYNGGYFSPAEGAIALVQGDKEGMRHELTHMLAWVSWGSVDLSPWFAEGQAQYHESGVEGSPGRGVESARELLSRGSWLPLRDILGASHTSFKEAGNNVYYAQSASLYAWLAATQKAGLERVVSMERLPGAAAPKDFEEAVGMPMADIERDWKAWAEK